ncbi:MAG: hypothetical protein K0S79_331 [Nitrospira sp.]|nr:hypothetical protein [Nitrospira sp.]
MNCAFIVNAQCTWEKHKTDTMMDDRQESKRRRIATVKRANPQYCQTSLRRLDLARGG